MEDIQKMNRNELRVYIRQQTHTVNERFKEYRDAVASGAIPENPMIEELRADLVKLGTGKETARGVGVGIAYKTKAQLQIQALALTEFVNFDQYTPEAQKKNEEFEAKAMRSLARSGIHFENRSDFRDFANVMDAVHSFMGSDFSVSSKEIGKYYHDFKKEKGGSALTFVKSVKTAYDSAKGAGLDEKQFADILQESL